MVNFQLNKQKKGAAHESLQPCTDTRKIRQYEEKKLINETIMIDLRKKLHPPKTHVLSNLSAPTFGISFYFSVFFSL